MKEIPNKIYIDEDLINYHCLTYRCEGDLEYIRKDALLEWLDANAHIVGPYERQKAFNDVIDKINTM